MNIEEIPFNVELFYLINHSRNAMLDFFFSYFYILGKGYVLCPAFLFVLLFQRHRWKLFLFSVAIESFLVHFLKFLFHAPRPASLLQNVYLLEPLYHKSFPSGDTAMAFLLFSFFSEGAKWYLKVPLLLYALLIAYGRIYLGVHFPLDVLAGALIGVSSYYLCKRLLRYN